MIYDCADDNIFLLREKHPNGLHFVVGDYNAGGNVHTLLQYISNYYQKDIKAPGFHLIRGNHERELAPVYTLENLPDILPRTLHAGRPMSMEISVGY